MPIGGLGAKGGLWIKKSIFAKSRFWPLKLPNMAYSTPIWINKVWSESGKNAFFLGKSPISLEGVLGSKGVHGSKNRFSPDRVFGL